MNKKRIHFQNKNSIIKHMFYLIGLGMGFLILSAGIVYSVIVFVRYYTSEPNNCCSNTPSIADLAIILITIGIGFLSLGFSVKGFMERRTDIRREYKANTSKAFNKYQAAISSNEYVFVTKTLNLLFKVSGFRKDFKNIEETFMKSFGISDALKNFYTKLDEKSIDKLYDEINTAINANVKYLNKDIKKEENGYAVFEVCLKKVLMSFEDICYQDLSFTSEKEVFDTIFYPTIKSLYLRSLLFIDLFELYENLVYTKFSILYRTNQDAEAKTYF